MEEISKNWWTISEILTKSKMEPNSPGLVIMSKNVLLDT